VLYAGNINDRDFRMKSSFFCTILKSLIK